MMDDKFNIQHLFLVSDSQKTFLILKFVNGVKGYY